MIFILAFHTGGGFPNFIFYASRIPNCSGQQGKREIRSKSWETYCYIERLNNVVTGWPSHGSRRSQRRLRVLVRGKRQVLVAFRSGVAQLWSARRHWHMFGPLIQKIFGKFLFLFWFAVTCPPVLLVAWFFHNHENLQANFGVLGFIIILAWFFGSWWLGFAPHNQPHLCD